MIEMSVAYPDRRPFAWRTATVDDMPALCALASAAIDSLLEDFLSGEQIEASRELMVVDRQLVLDATYYVILEGKDIVGCGGWSRRRALDGDHSDDRVVDLLDPRHDAARIRAIYTHPCHARRGIGRMAVEICERMAQEAGFGRFELLATLAGVPLYRACGYEEIAREELVASTGARVPGVLMRKSLCSGARKRGTGCTFRAEAAGRVELNGPTV